MNRLLLDDRLRTIVDALALIGYVQRLYATRPGLGIWLARDDADRFVGHFSLMPVGDGPEVEIGVRLLPEAWGHHYPVVGGRALLRHAFGGLGLERVLGFCHPDNHAVPVILRRLRFVPQGETTHFGKRALAYELTAARWAAGRTS